VQTLAATPAGYTDLLAHGNLSKRLCRLLSTRPLGPERASCAKLAAAHLVALHAGPLLRLCRDLQDCYAKGVSAQTNNSASLCRNTRFKLTSWHPPLFKTSFSHIRESPPASCAACLGSSGIVVVLQPPQLAHCFRVTPPVLSLLQRPERVATAVPLPDARCSTPLTARASKSLINPALSVMHPDWHGSQQPIILVELVREALFH